MANNEVSRLKFNDTTYEIADELARESVGTALTEVASVEAKADGYNTALSGRITNLENSSGAVLVAKTRTAMTDTNKIYVYTGTTTTASGVTYTKGHWYYHNGSKWTDGGEYNQNLDAIDATLTQSNKGADAKVTGDRLSAAESDISKLRGTIANDYASQVYSVGDYCYHDGLLYRCNTEIAAAEAWTSSHWTAVDVMPEISNLKNDTSYSVDFAPHGTEEESYGGVTFNYFYNKIVLSGRVENSIDSTRLMITMTEGTSPRFRAVSTILSLTTGLELEAGSMYKLTTLMEGTVLDDDGITEYNVNMSVYPCGQSSTIGRNYYSDNHNVDTLFVAPSLPVNLVVYLPKNRTYNCTLTWKLEKLDKLVGTTNSNEAILSGDDIDIFADNNYNRLIQDTTSYPGYSMRVACIKNTMRIDGKSPYNYLIRLNTGFEGSDTGRNFTDGINLVEGAKYRIYKYRLKGSSDYTAGPNINDINISVYPVQTPFVSNRTIATLYEYNENYSVYQFTAPAEPINVCAYIRHDIEYDDELFYFKVVTASEDNEDGVSDIFVTEMADTIAKVRAESSEPCLVFPFVTDIHYIKQGHLFTFNQFIQNLRYFTKRVKCDFVFNSGDAIDGAFNRQTSISHASDLQDGFNSLGTKYLFSVGNHDCNRYYENGAEIFTIQEIFGHLMSNVKPEVFNYGTNGTDFYVDFKEYGVRIVSINSTNSTVGTYAYSDSTVNWLDTALNTDLTVILCTHASPVAEQTADNDGNPIANYKLHVWFNNPAKIRFTNANNVSNKLATFAETHNLIVLTGHSHVDATFVDPFAEVTFASQLFEDADITTAGYVAINGTVDGLHKAQNILGTSDEDCWTVCVFKPVSKELSMIRFGAGKDQYLHYESRNISEGSSSVTLNSKLSKVVWSTSDASIATVSGGTVSAVSIGRCGIVATDQDGNREVYVIKVI